MPLSEYLSKRLNEVVEWRPKSPISLFWIEVAIFRRLAMAVKLTVGLIGLVFGLGYQGACPQCQRQMKFQRYAGRPVLGGFGLRRYERAYSYCPVGKIGSAPLDEALQVGEREVSPRLQRVMGFLSRYLSFVVVEKAVGERFEVSVSDETIQRVGEEIGQEARGWEQQLRQQVETHPEMMKRRAGVRLGR